MQTQATLLARRRNQSARRGRQVLMREKQVLMRGNKWVEMGTRRGKWQGYVYARKPEPEGENITIWVYGWIPNKIHARHISWPFMERRNHLFPS